MKEHIPLLIALFACHYLADYCFTRPKMIEAKMINIIRMKKVVLLLLALLLCSFSGHAQCIERLRSQEIIESQTPASVAYNFTIAILQKDFDKVWGELDLTAHEREEIDEYLKESGNTFETLYSQDEDVIALWSWLPALENGFEVVIADMEDLWKAKTDDGWMIDENQIVKDGKVYIPGEEKPYLGIHDIIVYVACSPASEINTVSFDDITLYEDTLLKVLLHNNNGKWLVEDIYFVSKFRQTLIEGTWFLQEVQIPSNEEYVDLGLFDRNKCIVFKPKNEYVTEEVVDIDDFNKAFDESYQKAVNTTPLTQRTEAVDTVIFDDLIRELYLISGVEYEITQDSVLVFYCPQKESYLIKRLTKDLLVLADNQQETIVYVFGRKEKPIKHTKNNHTL